MKTKPTKPDERTAKENAPALAETKPLAPIMHPDSLARIEELYQAWLLTWKKQENT